jgi:hypothetical protein
MTTAIKDHAVKWLVGAVGAAAISGGTWAWTKLDDVVTRDDLDGVVEMVGADVGRRLQPIVQQTNDNTRAICVARRAPLRASVRDLKVEIEEMQKKRGTPTWTLGDEALFREWLEDLDEDSAELAELRCE